MNIAFKRFLAYLIDMFIIFIIISCFKYFIPNQNEDKLTNLNQQYLEQKIDINEYNNQSKIIVHEIDKSNIYLNLLNTFLIIVFFIAIPVLLKGQTIGQKILKIKLVKDDLINVDDYIKRAVIINGLGYMFFMFIILYLTNDNIYYILINLLGFFQILLIIFNAFMVLYRKDKCGIADIVTNTRIEELK